MQPLLTMDVSDDAQGDVSLAESMLEQTQPDTQAEQDDAARQVRLTSPTSQVSDNVEVEGSGREALIAKDGAQPHDLASESTRTSKSIGDIGSLEDREVSLTPTENAMFGAMTESLKIPHFLFTHTIDVTGVNKLRRKFNSNASTTKNSFASKLTPLPFIMKAVSQAITQFPRLNSHLDTTKTPVKPRLIVRSRHNFGLAIDTPKGLLVPVVRGVEKHTLQSLATEIKRLGELAQAGRLAPDDFKDATFVITNIGSIGGDAVAPVILAPMVGIVGLGRIREMPVFSKDEQGKDEIVKQEQMILSWSADHRIIDGATVARAAGVVENSIRNFEQMDLSSETDLHGEEALR